MTDRANESVEPKKEMQADFAGERHPLSLPQDTASEKLSAGDHQLKLQDGRQYSIHIPENDGTTPLPVMFVITPSVNAPKGFDAKNFGAETGMSAASDKDKFIAVYPLPQKHLLGRYEREEGFAWNAPGSGLDDKDLKFAGYDDIAYIKSIANELPKLANVDTSHKDWGAVAFSQGGMFLNELVHEVPNLFPTVGLVGTTMSEGHDYSSAAGNAHNVMIVNLRADKSVLPFPGFKTESWTHLLERAKAEVLPHEATTWIAEKLSALGAIDNREQDPKLIPKQYISELMKEGPVASTSQHLTTPAKAQVKDTLTTYRPTDAKNPDGVYIYDLPEAQHAYPGPDRGIRVNDSPKYTEFDTTSELAKLFTNYNKSIKH